jgi:hypothetical protein
MPQASGPTQAAMLWAHLSSAGEAPVARARAGLIASGACLLFRLDFCYHISQLAGPPERPGRV